MVQNASDAPFPVPGEIEIHECADEQEEAEYVVSTIEGLIKSGHRDVEEDLVPESFGILGRNKFVFDLLETQLKKHGINFNKKVSAATYESESDIVEEFEFALRVLSNPLDRLHLGKLAARWKSTSDLDAIYGECDLRTVTGLQILERLEAQAKTGYSGITMTAIREVRWTPDDFKFLKGLESIEKGTKTVSDDERALVLQDVAQWKTHWNYFVRSEPGGKHSVPSFLNQVALGTTQQPQQDGVALLTVHSAKGMEFDVVFVIGMTEGTFPDFRAKGEAMQEECRNAFVAVTRSRRLLYLTYPKLKQMPWGDSRAQQPSRFVKALQAMALPN